jgi:hypothetical protein
MADLDLFLRQAPNGCGYVDRRVLVRWRAHIRYRGRTRFIRDRTRQGAARKLQAFKTERGIQAPGRIALVVEDFWRARITYHGRTHTFRARTQQEVARKLQAFKTEQRIPTHDFWARVKELPGRNGCWVWQGATTYQGYGTLGGVKKFFAHRVSYELTRGPIPPGMWVCHKCDNPPCVRPSHLFLGDRWANNDDMVKKGRHYEKVSWIAILLLRLLRDEGWSYDELGKEFGVNPGYANMLYTGYVPRCRHTG